MANAIPADEQVNIYQGSPDDVVLFNDNFYNLSTMPDGTDSTVRLEAGGGDNVGQVRFQYSTNGGTTWTTIGTPVTRNDDGNFFVEWTVPAFLLTDTIELRVQDFTGGVQGTDYIQSGVYVGDDEESVNLTAGTAKGYFVDCGSTEQIGLTGTTSETDPTGDIWTYYHEADDNDYYGSAQATIEGGATPAATTGTFNSVMDISGYDFTPPDPTPPADPNQITTSTEVQ
ncbi:MAG: hypothetical protein M3237_02270, partial [Actinomycetota bacterium]|nr:hypothetical protein [Actinomycetota bacterium]